MKAFVLSEDVLQLAHHAVFEAPSPSATEQEADGPFPRELLEWLARLRLLQGVPFPYLVAHEDLLPPESIRFFYLDRNWSDSMVEGALAAGCTSTRDRAKAQQVYGELRDAIDRTERKLWAQFARGTPEEGVAEVVTGFLLRSRAVSGWPGLHVRGFDASKNEMRLLRMERLAPAVLLVLFDGVPHRVEIEEPKQGIQFGVDQMTESTFAVNARHPDSGEVIKQVEVPVPFRRDSPGVIAVDKLRRDLLAAAPDALQPEGEGDTGLSPAEYALQLLQYPFLQFFGERPAEPQELFKYTLPMQFVVASYGGST